ncbi:MAG: undecaprenyl-phosphate galactose phosphotransferase WbaP [Rhodospirillales bacterium]|nr:undecaprenyl-phosphate galactose phosphotransferase WbaP [Rhodospirillales bacterium]
MQTRRLTLLIADVIGMVLALFIAAIAAATFSELFLDRIYPHFTSPDTKKLIILYGILSGVGVVWFFNKGHYGSRTPWWQQVEHVILFCLSALLIEGFVSYALQTPLPRLWVSLSWLLAVPCILIYRWAARAILIKTGHWAKPTILIGGYLNANETLYALKSDLYLKYDVKYVVLLGATQEEKEKFQNAHGDIEIKSELGDMQPRDYIVLAPDFRDQILLKNTIAKIKEFGAHYAIVPPLEGFSLYGLYPQYFFGYGIVLLEPMRRLQTLSGRFMKSALDKTVAFLILTVFSPVFLFLIWQVKKDGGPAFYGQTRIGRDGNPFKCWKFRSMVTNADDILKDLLANNPEAQAEWEKDFKLKDDPRITKIGQLLRKTSLDEIPQLFNVLRGDMSLVGPRPIVEDEKKYYADQIKYYLAVKPGITGMWQVSGRNDITYAQRVYLDGWYVKHWSIWHDIVILIKTVFVVIGRRGAY